MPITIRPEQLAALERAAARAFENRLIAHLLAMYPERLEDLEDEELRALCRSGLEAARRYGIRTAYDLSRYLEYVVYFGAGFDRLPWANAILTGEGSGRLKMDAIDAAVRGPAASR